MALHNAVGKEGEEIARRYLERKGYAILEQNYKTRRAEIDLIAQIRQGLFGKSTVVFIEVRTKSSELYGTPEETITKAKRMRLKRNAAAYIHKVKYNGLYRIDAICVVFRSHGMMPKVRHYENIVED